MVYLRFVCELEYFSNIYRIYKMLESDFKNKIITSLTMECINEL